MFSSNLNRANCILLIYTRLSTRSVSNLRVYISSHFSLIYIFRFTNQKAKFFAPNRLHRTDAITPRPHEGRRHTARSPDSAFQVEHLGNGHSAKWRGDVRSHWHCHHPWWADPSSRSNSSLSRRYSHSRTGGRTADSDWMNIGV